MINLINSIFKCLGKKWERLDTIFMRIKTPDFVRWELSRLFLSVYKMHQTYLHNFSKFTTFDFCTQ